MPAVALAERFSVYVDLIDGDRLRRLGRDLGEIRRACRVGVDHTSSDLSLESWFGEADSKSWAVVVTVKSRLAVSQDKRSIEVLDRGLSHVSSGCTLWDTGELDSDITHGRIMVGEVDDEVVAFVRFERPLGSHFRITRLVVDGTAGDPGVGVGLLDELLSAIRNKDDLDNMSISVLVDMDDVFVLGIFFRVGFVAVKAFKMQSSMTTYRLYLCYKGRVDYVDSHERYLIPITAQDSVVEVLSSDGRAITALVKISGRPAFEVAKFEQDDLATLQSAEAAAGIGFSAAVLAAITFLLGFAFASSRYPDGVRILLIGAIFATTVSLIIYASASGELARIRANAFGDVMKWGNVLSEYGGVLPFIISLPITYAQVAKSPWSSLVVALISGLALYVYETSRFSISSRFKANLASWILLALTSVAPIAGVLGVVYAHESWPWSVAVVAILSARSVIYLFLRGSEADKAEHRRIWEVRRPTIRQTKP